MAPTRKSMKNLAVSIGGIVVVRGGGEGDFIQTTAPTQFATKTGVHGDVVFFDTPDNVYEVTLTTLETQALNESLQGLFTSQKASSTQGPFTMTIQDVGTGERLSGPTMIIKGPDVAKTAEAQNYDWMLHLASEEGWQFQVPQPITP